MRRRGASARRVSARDLRDVARAVTRMSDTDHVPSPKPDAIDPDPRRAAHGALGHHRLAALLKAAGAGDVVPYSDRTGR